MQLILSWPIALLVHARACESCAQWATSGECRQHLTKHTHLATCTCCWNPQQWLMLLINTRAIAWPAASHQSIQEKRNAYWLLLADREVSDSESVALAGLVSGVSWLNTVKCAFHRCLSGDTDEHRSLLTIVLTHCMRLHTA
jgi:hypothetical protein